MEPLLELDNIGYSYPTGEDALRGLNFRLRRQEILAVLGANGAGKSTLFWQLNGLFRPAIGEIRLDGQPLSSYSPKEVRRRVGLVFQEPDDQLFSPTVAQEIAFGLLNLGLPMAEIAARRRRYLQLVGLEGYDDRAPHHLSGGEKKRVALAAVLAMEPEILVLDEPTAGLDPEAVEGLLALLSEVNQRLGVTIIYATHDLDLVPELATRVILLKQGRLVADGPPGEILAQEELLRSAGLRPPRLTQLFSQLRHDSLWPMVGALPVSLPEAVAQLSAQLNKTPAHSPS